MGEPLRKLEIDGWRLRAEQRGHLQRQRSASPRTGLFAPTEYGGVSLTTGKLNAMRAASKEGVKPSAIARQFGISQSDVRKALAQGMRREA